MKYVLKNLKQFVTKNRLVFVLFIFCQIVSILILLLSYGVYMNYKENYDQEFLSTAGLYGDGFIGEEGKKLQKNEFEYMLFAVELTNYYNPLTYEEIKPFCLELTDYFDKKLDYMLLQFFTKPINTEDYSKYINEYQSTPVSITLFIAKHDGEYTFEKTTRYADENSYGTLSSGRWFTDSELQKGEAVCIADLDSIKKDILKPATIREENGETYITLCGIEYKVIGTMSRGSWIIIPFTSAPKDMYLWDNFCVKFTEPLTVEEHNKYVSLIKKYFGDMVDDDTLEVATVNIDKQYFYNTNIWLSVIIALAAAVNLAVLYRYVLMTRRKTLAIFRLVGAKKNKIRRIYIAETLGISVAVFALCAVLFNYAVLPWLIKYYPYCSEVYSIKVYGTMFLIYIIVSYIVLNAMIITHISKSPVKLLKEGR